MAGSQEKQKIKSLNNEELKVSEGKKVEFRWEKGDVVVKGETGGEIR